MNWRTLIVDRVLPGLLIVFALAALAISVRPHVAETESTSFAIAAPPGFDLEAHEAMLAREQQAAWAAIESGAHLVATDPTSP